jgi:hypothetical protein
LELEALKHRLDLDRRGQQVELDWRRDEAQFARTRELQLKLQQLAHEHRINEQRQHFLSVQADKEYDYFRTYAWPLREPPSGLPIITSDHNHRQV